MFHYVSSLLTLANSCVNDESALYGYTWTVLHPAEVNVCTSYVTPKHQESLWSVTSVPVNCLPYPTPPAPRPRHPHHAPIVNFGDHNVPLSGQKVKCTIFAPNTFMQTSKSPTMGYEKLGQISAFGRAGEWRKRLEGALT